MKVSVTDECTKLEQERIGQFLQDSLGWKEGTDFSIQRRAASSNAPQATSDELLTCADCSGPFTFSVGEQTFFAQNSLKPPKRCPDCRKKRKADKSRDETRGRGFPRNRAPARRG